MPAGPLLGLLNPCPSQRSPDPYEYLYLCHFLAAKRAPHGSEQSTAKAVQTRGHGGPLSDVCDLELFAVFEPLSDELPAVNHVNRQSVVVRLYFVFLGFVMRHVSAQLPTH